MLMDLLNKVATTALLGFVVSSMMAMGVGFTVRQIIDALRNVRLVLLALLANFVAMPLGALALDKMLRLDEPLGVGLLLLGTAAGAPFLPKLTELAKGNLPFAVGIMMLLAIGTVGYLPLVLPLLLPGVAFNSAKIAGWLFLLTLLPLAAGLALRARYGRLAAQVKPVLDWATNVSLVPMVLLLAAANTDKILHVFGTRGILAGFLLIAWASALAGCLEGLASTRDGHWPLVPGSATSPPHLWLRAKASLIQARARQSWHQAAHEVVIKHHCHIHSIEVRSRGSRTIRRTISVNNNWE
jgi:BASS family bile acid:Na+ symporter